MVIYIHDNKKLLSVKEEFNLLFPFLKIEFFKKPHLLGEGNPKLQVISEQKTIGECRKNYTMGLLEITPDMTVANLEESFRNVYGLNIQVFRKSGSVWLETTVTDKWTLNEQNKQGESLTLHMAMQKKKREYGEEYDWD